MDPHSVTTRNQTAARQRPDTKKGRKLRYTGETLRRIIFFRAFVFTTNMKLPKASRIFTSDSWEIPGDETTRRKVKRSYSVPPSSLLRSSQGW